MNWQELYVRSDTVVNRNGCPYDTYHEEDKAKDWVAAEIRSGRARMWRGCGTWVWRNICEWSGVADEPRLKARDRALRRAADKLRELGWTVMPPNANIHRTKMAGDTVEDSQ